jgi:hypothetical protein
MAFFATIKFILFAALGWFIGKQIANWEERRRVKYYALKEFAPDHAYSFKGGLNMGVKKGKTLHYLAIDHMTGSASMLASGREAAIANTMGKDVWTFEYHRLDTVCTLTTTRVNQTTNPFNFLTGKFYNPVKPEDQHVQIFEN